MHIAGIYSFNRNIYNFQKNKTNTSNNTNKQILNNTASVPVRSIVSFASSGGDKRTAKAYFKEYKQLLVEDRKLRSQGVWVKQELVDFFDRIKKESPNIQKEFLKVNFNEEDSVYGQSLYMESPYATEQVLKLFDKMDEKFRADFLAPDSASYGSPFYMAADADITHASGKKLRKMVKNLSPENQGKFYYYKTKSIFLKDNTVIDELKCGGYLEFARLLEEDRNKFAKNYPELAKKYEEQYKDIEEKDSDNNKCTEADTKDEDNHTTFRVYEKVKTRFSDVGGMFNVKKQIRNELLNIINNPRVKNADKPSGIILYGPPGTGKTLLATAIAGEAGVPFISTAGSGFNEIYIGSGAKRVRELYKEARKLARNNPSKTAIVFIDEADSVAGKRSGSSNKENDHTLNALLSELDGVQTKEENDIKIITILATNRKDLFDDAFRRGRIDLEFKIDDPRLSEKARKEILQISAKDKPFKNEEEKEKILSNLAQTSSGMSGAELADVIKRAYRKTLYLGRQTFYITPKDINEAKLEALIGIKNDSEKSEFEQKSVIAHEAGHAINQLIMNRIYANENEKSKHPIQKVDFIVNESRGDAAGVTIMKPSPDNHRLTVESLISYLVVGYGGYSIEEEMFDGHTDGVSSDLNSNTNLILNSVTKWGLGSTTKFIGCSTDGLSYELFKKDIKQDIIDYSNKAMTISSKISAFVRPFIESYVNTFINATDDKASIITGERFEKMFDKWLKENGNKKDYDELCKDIKDSIKDFKDNIKKY